MKLNLSYSAVNKFTSCGKSYEFHYKDKIRPQYKGSALYFGSAIDLALNFMLVNLTAPNLVELSYAEFLKNWTKFPERDGTTIDLKTYDKILYSKSDFDGDLLTKEDWVQIFLLAQEPSAKYEAIKGKLADKHFSELPKEDQVFYNTLNWFSLKNKAKYMIEAYHRDIVPQIGEVIAVQKPIELLDDDGNKIAGYVDLICKLKNGIEVVADNKTSSVTYEDDAVSTSSQLAQYKAILNAVYGHNIQHGCYFVVNKKMSYKKVCEECGKHNTSTHKLCPEIIDGARCNGEFDKVPYAETSTFVETIPDSVTNMVLENFDVAVKSINAGLFTRNFAQCHGKYGKCEYIDFCFKGKDTHLERAGK